jgi:5'-nucleotidase
MVSPIEDTEPGTDRYAIEHGRTSMTPLRLDLTDNETLARFQRSESKPPGL